MKKKISKKDLDETIRLYKKYFRTGDKDILPAMNNKLHQAFGEEDSWIDRIITGITLKRIANKDEPYETYYKVLETLGYTIDKEDDKKRTGEIEEEKQE